MEIEPQSLTTCEVAPDGNTVVLCFTDSNGTPAKIRLSLNQIGGLAMTLPDAAGALAQACRRACLRRPLQDADRDELIRRCPLPPHRAGFNQQRFLDR
jgi:hypothetical protein